MSAPLASPLAPATTTLASAAPLLAGIPDAMARRRILKHENAYKTKLRVARERERASLKAQEAAVALAVQAGKDKRQVRKLKNRLSAIRSRQRKEAEQALAHTRLQSLEEQVRGLSKLIHRLQSKRNSSNHRDDSDLGRLARGRLALREDPQDPPVPVPRVRGAGTRGTGHGALQSTGELPGEGFLLVIVY